MDWKRLANRAKEQIDKRGGTEGLKRDATNVKDIARSPGSLTDKAKQAAEVLKQPTGAEKTSEAAKDQGGSEKPAEAAPAEAGSEKAPAGAQPTEAQRSK
jgi:hypothetical protein